MKVKLLVANIGFNGKDAGEVIELDDKIAQKWIARGIAEEVKETKKAPRKAPTKKAPAKKEN